MNESDDDFFDYEDNLTKNGMEKMQNNEISSEEEDSSDEEEELKDYSDETSHKQSDIDDLNCQSSDESETLDLDSLAAKYSNPNKKSMDYNPAFMAKHACFHCGGSHNVKDCPNHFCFNCGKSGHSARKCTSRVRVEMFCPWCLGNHCEDECHILSNPFCIYCGSYEHLSRECVNTSNSDKNLSCYICGGRHASFECQRLSNLKREPMIEMDQRKKSHWKDKKRSNKKIHRPDFKKNPKKR
eukprot:TRINITY_DN100_c0_g1_i1.p1 TRINITY_DN100_c0_g1~~TRINITY_DN100_c0_g1_i1.p1  ORF type:complete len:250 (-),score=71.22 TRINITY_DN100_c0_g1_i1:39-761(-)